MDEPIFKIYLNRFRDAWYQLSDEERNSFIEKHNKAFADLGIKDTIFCDTSWSTEEWDFAGVAEYPNIQAVMQLRKLQEEWGWYRYVDAKCVLGTKLDVTS